MNQDNHNFLPQSGDSQVERPIAPGSPSEARLLQDLQAMYDLEQHASIERVWTRLGRQRANAHDILATDQMPEESDLQAYHHRSERHSNMQQNITHITPHKSFSRFFGLVAAVLVCAAIVGSLGMILNTMRSTPPTTGLGSQPGKSQATPTAYACYDTHDSAEQQLCQAHAEQILNISKTYGTHQVTFVRAYASTTRMILIYTTTDPATSDVISFTSLTAQQRITLQGGMSWAFSDPEQQQWYYAISFDTQNVPAGTTELHFQSIVDAFSGQPSVLKFTLPFHKA